MIAAGSSTQKRRVLAAAAIVAAVASVSFLGWFTVRAGIGASRHALDAQEGPKDALFLALRPACSGVNGGKFVIPRGHPDRVQDASASGTAVYRYVVLHAATLDDDKCMRVLVSTAKALPYPTVMVFSDRGRQVVRLEFIPRS
jgi:hypothetical protein